MSGKQQLRCYMNLMALDSMPMASTVPRGNFEERIGALAEAGFAGIQFAERGTPTQIAFCRAQRMGIAAAGRINTPEEASPFAEQMADEGYECVTLHVGWGLEDDAEAEALIGAILEASDKWKTPLYIETHRATICQDMWRTVQLIKRFPEMRFNGDFSHWYAGQEMVYGGFERKFAYIQPVLQRVRFLHGRIANAGCIQVALRPDTFESSNESQPEYVQHFRKLWTACFRAFLQGKDDEYICFTPELLGPEIYYARIFEGKEEGDRWQQSLMLKKMAEECFQSAQL